MIFTGEAEFPLMVGGLRYALYYLAGRSLSLRGCIGRPKKIQTLCGSYIAAQQLQLLDASGNYMYGKAKR